MQEVADWIAARLLPEETPEMLAAIDEGLRSLETEPTVSADEVRRNIRAWATRQSFLHRPIATSVRS
jgi:hypothetical protein